MKETAGSNRCSHFIGAPMKIIEEFLGPQIICKELWLSISPRFDALGFLPVTFTEAVFGNNRTIISAKSTQ
jgi:hypothetical protein